MDGYCSESFCLTGCFFVFFVGLFFSTFRRQVRERSQSTSVRLFCNNVVMFTEPRVGWRLLLNATLPASVMLKAETELLQRSVRLISDKVLTNPVTMSLTFCTKLLT